MYIICVHWDIWKGLVELYGQHFCYTTVIMCNFNSFEHHIYFKNQVYLDLRYDKGGACTTQRIETYKFLVRKYEDRRPLLRHRRDFRKILKWILEFQCVKG